MDGLTESGVGVSGGGLMTRLTRGSALESGLSTVKKTHGHGHGQSHQQQHQQQQNQQSLEDSREHLSDRDRSARLDGSTMTTLLDQSLDMGVDQGDREDHQGGLSSSGLGASGLSMHDGVNTTHDLRGGSSNHNNHNQNNHKGSTKLHGSAAQNHHNNKAEIAATHDVLGKYPTKVVPSSEVFESVSAATISASVKRRRA